MQGFLLLENPTEIIRMWSWKPCQNSQLKKNFLCAEIISKSDRKSCQNQTRNHVQLGNCLIFTWFLVWFWYNFCMWEIFFQLWILARFPGSHSYNFSWIFQQKKSLQKLWVSPKLLEHKELSINSIFCPKIPIQFPCHIL